MAYNITKTKDESLAQLQLLTSAFAKDYSNYSRPEYSEAQLRIDFINPLLKTFGWDVDNESLKSQFVRDVIQEEAIEVEENDTITKKNPDYTLRVEGVRKTFVEAKKVALKIEKSSSAAFQTRRYGWNANLGISILTNFDTLVVYDCRFKPVATDDAFIARYATFHYTEYENSFDKLYDLLSFDSVSSGYLDDYFSLTQNDLTTFDDYFLSQIEKWRRLLAEEVFKSKNDLEEEDINFLVQRLLNRIVFLRICEDREIEKFETLRNVKSYEELKALFIQSDQKYNSGLFDFIEDNFSLDLNLNSDTLIGIFNELYYPESPYDFSIVDPSILSQIYERYLGSKIVIVDSDKIDIIEEPEVSASNGVIPTPKRIAENIVKETLHPLFVDKDSVGIKQLKIADICCGSGIFLLSVYDYITERIVTSYISEGLADDSVLHKKFDGSYHLTLKSKQEILNNNIYGVDINPYAVEVTKFSLCLKLLEGENTVSINQFLADYDQKVLPGLDDNIRNGNSLIDEKYYDYNEDAIVDEQILYKVKPFEWKDEFPFLEQRRFDAIVGNPPYVRIQNMVKYLSEEVKYYQNKMSGYSVAQNESFDKYYLFIQRALELLCDSGYLGYVVPNKFFIVKGGKTLRHLISSGKSLYKVLHFGVLQVFPKRTTYVAIVILSKNPKDNVLFKKVKSVTTDLVAGAIQYFEYDSNLFTEQPWIFVSEETQRVFNKLKANSFRALKDVADISVGLQTSDDEVYIFTPYKETEETFKFKKGGVDYEIEKGVCKPCIYDLSFSLFDSIRPNAQMIFPYTIVDGKAEVLSEEFLIDNYPMAWVYLNHFKDQLVDRSISGGKEPKWYQFGRSQSLTKFMSLDKLIWPVLSTKPSYILDRKDICFTGGGNGPYYSLTTKSDYSLLYFLGILSHPLFEEMVRIGASTFRGAYYSHGKQFLANLPIRLLDLTNDVQKRQHDNIVDTVNRLINTKEKYNSVYENAKKKVHERALNFLIARMINQVNEIYNINSSDLDTVFNDELLSSEIKED